jgi:formylglycine-generating enzyme required for sulfatase activity
LNAWKIEHSRLADKESMEEWWKEKASTLRRENTRQRLQEAVEEKIPVALRAIDKKSLHQWGQEWSQKAWEEYTPEQALDWWTQKQAQLHLQSSYPALQRQGEQAASENKERRKEAGEASYCQQVLDVWGEADVHKMTMEQVEAWWPEALNNVELGPSRAVLEKARLKALRPFAGTQRALEVLPEAREIYCPAGTFRMGASPGDDEALECEKPAREVTLTCGFWALSTPVTQAMYKAVMGENPSKFKGESRPVENVSWYDAVEFCNQLSHKAGLSPAYQTEKATGFFSGFFGDGKVAWLQESEGYRLPTEAEWEYFCRAGSTGSRYGNLDEIAWYKENSDNRTSPVGQKAPNAWGFYDTLGNVWEWCVDKWDEQAYSRLPQLNPAHLPHSADKRVRRGGGWSSDTRGSRASYRFWDVASLRYNHGFRVVRTSVVRAKQ